jgi:hypothetical protein
MLDKNLILNESTQSLFIFTQKYQKQPKTFFYHVTFWGKVMFFGAKHYIRVQIFFPQYGVDGYKKTQNLT